MRHVPAIPESTRDSITWRLLQHAGANWPQLSTVQVRYRGSFAYIVGVLPGGEQIPLCRLRYGGSATLAPRSTPPPAELPTTPSCAPASRPAPPQEALDTACTVHLAALGHEPPHGPRRTYGATH